MFTHFRLYDMNDVVSQLVNILHVREETADFA